MRQRNLCIHNPRQSTPDHRHAFTLVFGVVQNAAVFTAANNVL